MSTLYDTQAAHRRRAEHAETASFPLDTREAPAHRRPSRRRPRTTHRRSRVHRRLSRGVAVSVTAQRSVAAGAAENDPDSEPSDGCLDPARPHSGPAPPMIPVPARSADSPAKCVSAAGMQFAFVSESFETPTSWRFNDTEHVVVVHRCEQGLCPRNTPIQDVLMRCGSERRTEGGTKAAHRQTGEIRKRRKRDLRIEPVLEQFANRCLGDWIQPCVTRGGQTVAVLILEMQSHGLNERLAQRVRCRVVAIDDLGDLLDHLAQEGIPTLDSGGEFTVPERAVGQRDGAELAVGTRAHHCSYTRRDGPDVAGAGSHAYPAAAEFDLLGFGAAADLPTSAHLSFVDRHGLAPTADLELAQLKCRHARATFENGGVAHSLAGVGRAYRAGRPTNLAPSSDAGGRDAALP